MLSVDFNSEIPIYQQIVNEVLKGIYYGEIKRGETMPSVRQLASEMGVNLHTINKSYQILRDMGYIIMDRRSGARISDDFGELSSESIGDLEEKLKNILMDYFIKGMTKEDVEIIIDKIYK